MKRLKHRIEAVAVSLLFGFFKMLPLDTASAIGGFMTRAIGPYLRAHTIATNNLKLIFPDMIFSERHRILTGMWDNLGRVGAELPHLAEDEIFKRMDIIGSENLPAPGTPVLFFSGHIGNWELSYPVAHRAGLNTTLVYREANNPIVDQMINEIRATRASSMFAKGSKNSLRILRAIEEGGTLLMLTDQKMNEGMAIPFFGYDAMTAATIAKLVLRFDLPLIPARVIRKGGCHFEARIQQPIVYKKTGNQQDDIRAILTAMNATLESWIREYPEQWFWVHRRWPKEPKKSEA